VKEVRSEIVASQTTAFDPSSLMAWKWIGKAVRGKFWNESTVFLCALFYDQSPRVAMDRDPIWVSERNRDV